MPVGDSVTSPVLAIDSISAGYGDATVLRDVTLRVDPGSVVALLGANGAGKTTLLRVASGVLRPSAGSVRVAETLITDASPDERVAHGLCHIPEGRGIFRTLTVGENLRMFRPAGSGSERIEEAFEAFPRLRERLGQVAGTLSGGEQQMLALARAYLVPATITLLDEVSIGLAPTVVDLIYERIADLRRRGMALLLVEQYVERALALADDVYVLHKGRVAWHGPPAGLDGSDLTSAYLGHALDKGSPRRRPHRSRRVTTNHGLIEDKLEEQ